MLPPEPTEFVLIHIPSFPSQLLVDVSSFVVLIEQLLRPRQKHRLVFGGKLRVVTRKAPYFEAAVEMGCGG